MRNFALSLALMGWVAGCESAASYPLSEAPAVANPAEPSAALGPPRYIAAGVRSDVLAAPESKPSDAQLVQRQVIYSGAVRLVVVSMADAVNNITTIAKELDGYLQESSGNAISIRVPAGKFDEAMARIGKLGEVVDRTVKASDVTEEMLDVNLRLETARKTRDRLLAHLEKSDKMENTLKIEAEVRRLSEEIEQMEGRLRFMQSQVAMSTIRVELNSNAPKVVLNGGDRLGVPFPWVAQLGGGLVAGSIESMPRQPQFLDRGPNFTPPPGFVRYYSSRDLVEAMSADGLRIKVQRQDNYDRGGLLFWKTLIRKTLVETRSLAANDERELDADTGWISGTRDVGGTQYGYALLVKRDNDHVWTFEAWGPAQAFEPQRAAIEVSARTLKR